MSKRSVKKQRLNERFNMDGNQVESAKDLVYKATDLQDHETAAAVRVIRQVQLKYRGRPNTAKNLDILRDEILTRLAEIGVLASFDPTPCLSGLPPEVEIIGKVGSIDQAFDHEYKAFEVNEAKKRGEDYRGQKERNPAEKKV